MVSALSSAVQYFLGPVNRATPEEMNWSKHGIASTDQHPISTGTKQFTLPGTSPVWGGRDRSEKWLRTGPKRMSKLPYTAGHGTPWHSDGEMLPAHRRRHTNERHNTAPTRDQHETNKIPTRYQQETEKISRHGTWRITSRMNHSDEHQAEVKNTVPVRDLMAATPLAHSSSKVRSGSEVRHPGVSAYLQ